MNLNENLKNIIITKDVTTENGSIKGYAIDLTDVILTTERLILRSWKQSDVNDFYEYASVPGVGEMAGWKPHPNIEKSREILDIFIKEKDVFAIALKETGKVIGSFGIHKISIAENTESKISTIDENKYNTVCIDNNDKISSTSTQNKKETVCDCNEKNVYNHNENCINPPLTAEIGYVLSKNYWGRGLMPEAAKCVIKWCFEKLNFAQLTVTHFEENLQSKSVILKCGFTPFATEDFYSEKLDAHKKSIRYRLKNIQAK